MKPVVLIKCRETGPVVRSCIGRDYRHTPTATSASAARRVLITRFASRAFEEVRQDRVVPRERGDRLVRRNGSGREETQDHRLDELEGGPMARRCRESGREAAPPRHDPAGQDRNAAGADPWS